jgi:copper transport protein
MHRRLRAAIGATVLAWGVALAMPHPASAHALAQSSVPADGSSVQQPPSVVSITFGETPDPRLSTIAVLASSGESVDAGPAHPAPGDSLTLQQPVKPLARGVYTVTWRTVSTVDGHYAAGTLSFGVGVSPDAVVAAAPPSSAGSTPPPSALAVAGRWSLFAGLVVLLGAALVSAVVVRGAPRPLLRLAAAGWVLAVFGTYAVAEAQRSAAGASWADVFATSLGHQLVERIIPAAIAGVAVLCAVLWRGASVRAVLVRRVALVVAGLAAAGGMWVDAASSHAGGQSPAAFNLLMQWLHVVAVGVWIGGLAALLLCLRGLEREHRLRVVRRMSAAAAAALLLVVVTGIVRSVVEVQSWYALGATPFGRLVILKLALVAVLALLGALNRWRHVPRVVRGLRGLRVVGSTEVLIGAAALLVAAALVNVSPPASAAPPPTPSQVVASGSDAGTTVKLQLTATPGSVGFNRFTARVVDYDTGQPVPADGVQLRFTLPSRSDVGTSTLDLKPAADGTYTGSGANLSLAGSWQVTALVVHGAQSVEVPLQVTPRIPPPRVEVRQGGGGIPTLSIVHLGDGRSVQVYLDPDRPGPLTFHSTFFDAKGTELPVTTCTITMTPPGGSATPLTLRMLEPGHFVADVTMHTGRYHFEMNGSTASGESIAAGLDVSAGS